MSEEELNIISDYLDNKIILHNAIKEPINKDLDIAIKLSVAYEQLQQENQQLKEQLSEKTRSEFKLKDELLKKRKEYQETYKDVRTEIKEYKQQLKQRDEVINKVSKLLEYYYIGNLKYDKESQRAFERIFDLLNRYKGDNNE